ncbi:O-antigen ligase family protein [Helicobacter cappadocius]|uniref:O-antigen ligase family protein n=1 Tax=Helicobacter cappadocius TaxID=3063998 RepID=A0AA90PJN0_9HELI|nr:MULTISPECIES: O-antigen ligase family protein [unclassified Helicobacter]MDO7253207.1 O-antigen ligase family protein [Helicobacter sp. faydin-H75]MDP2539131.1 O-antigen ligase family protein [Helicobacter sp. faydin-H76]
MGLRSDFLILADDMFLKRFFHNSVSLLQKNYFFAISFLATLAYFLLGVVSFRFGAFFVFLAMIIYLCHHRFCFGIFLKDISVIWFGILSYIGVLFMALLSVYFSADKFGTLDKIEIFLILPFFLMLFFYVLVKNLEQKAFYLFSFFFSVAILSQPFATIYHYFTINSDRVVGFGDVSIIPYSLFLLLSFALCVSMIIYLKGRFKIFSCLLLCVSLFAMYANGTRALILCVVVMVFAMMVLFRNEINKKISVAISLSMFLVLLGGYFSSTYFGERFNFKKIFSHIGTVWSYAPAQMGRFDKNCFKEDSDYNCSKLSGDKLDERFSFESNSLNRLSLWKSAYVAIMKNPLIPNGFYSRFFNKNLSNIIKPDSMDYFYPRDKYTNAGYYTHMHNMILSFLFELGIVGFLLIIAIFFAIFRSFILFLHRTNNLYEKLLVSSGILFLVGFWISMFFDSIISFSNTNYTFFALLGIFLGISHRRDSCQ